MSVSTHSPVRSRSGVSQIEDFALRGEHQSSSRVTPDLIPPAHLRWLKVRRKRRVICARARIQHCKMHPYDAASSPVLMENAIGALPMFDKWSEQGQIL